ncbi:MAG: hypothetical protein WBF89_05950 [Steroidobacteraceae bacterium]
MFDKKVLLQKRFTGILQFLQIDISAHEDARHDALRRTLGAVPCVPTVDGSERRLPAAFEGRRESLPDRLYTGSDFVCAPGNHLVTVENTVNGWFS